MTQEFTYTTEIGPYDDEVEITYSYSPGRPEQGPSYACGGEPAEGPEIEIIGVTHGGKPSGIHYDFVYRELYADDQRLFEFLDENARESWQSRKEAAAEARFEDRRERSLEE